MSNLKSEFEGIYTNNIWGVHENLGNDVKFYSGPGSHTPFVVSEFVRTINDFMESHEITSVVDLGCGDFNVGKRFLVDKYIGVDVCEPLIEYNRKEYSNEHISFVNANGVEEKLPSADLLIIKEVLQHLTLDEIKSLLSNNFSQYKYIIVADSRFDNSSNPNCDGDLTMLRNVGREMYRSGIFLDKEPFDYNVERLHKIIKNDPYVMDISLISK